VSKDQFVPPSDWPDTTTEGDLGDLAEQAEALRPRSLQAQAIVAEVVELLWLAQQTEIASRLAVWRAQGYRPPLIKGALPQSGKLGFKGSARAGDATS
jgi:hypothetical protein